MHEELGTLTAHELNSGSSAAGGSTNGSAGLNDDEDGVFFPLLWSRIDDGFFSGGVLITRHLLQ